MKTWQIMVAWGSTASLGGCSTYPNAPLVFYQATTVGISASTTGSSATPELSLGYRDTDVALVPVTDEAGKPIRAINPAPTGGAKFSDAMSVFGQFQVNTNAGTATNAGLGKFFATGIAAQDLAAGFRDWQRQGLKPLAPAKAGGA
jgi:hypothetical protein